MLGHFIQPSEQGLGFNTVFNPVIITKFYETLVIPADKMTASATATPSSCWLSELVFVIIRLSLLRISGRDSHTYPTSMSALVSGGLYFDDDLNLSLTSDLPLFDDDPFLLPPDEEDEKIVLVEEETVSSSPDGERQSEKSQSPLSVHNYSKNGSSEDDESSSPPSHRANSHTSRGPIERNLTEEEKRLLAKEGYSNFPDPALDLTKQQERLLRKIRRKIRNKKSAQCSRQRKKEYMEQLERKFDKCCSENANLKREIAKLRQENASLSSKVKNLLSGSTHFRTSLQVLCISAILLLLPLFRPDSLLDSTDQLLTSTDQTSVGRHLLSTEMYQSTAETNWEAAINWTVGL